MNQTAAVPDISERSGKPDVYDRDIEKTWEAIDALIRVMWETGKLTDVCGKETAV